jgi:hypothetical protein
VPPEPLLDAGQYLYLFNGMQPASSSPLKLILQPVLEWGMIAGTWSVASWIYPDPDGTVHMSSHVPVVPGTNLVGTIRLAAQSGGLFTYSCEFENLPDTFLRVDNMPELIWCVEALEAYKSGGSPPYDLDDIKEYPNTDRTSFGGIRVEAGASVGALDWDVWISPAASFGQHTKVISKSSTGGQVDIFYH